MLADDAVEADLGVVEDAAAHVFADFGDVRMHEGPGVEAGSPGACADEEPRHFGRRGGYRSI
jgi:hypothetical protein